MNLGLQLALGGLMRRASQWVGELINDAVFIVARNDTLSVNENARLDLQVTASKTTGPNPLVVVFDLFTGSTFHGVSRPEHECSFWADFDDEGSTYENIPADSLFGNDANIGHGPEMCHAWETTGVKTVKFYVWHPPTNRYGYAEVEITVVDADTYFSGRTVVCSQTSDFTGAPAGATQTTSFADAYSALIALGSSTPARLLFNGAETFTVTQQIYARQNFHYGSYGTGKATLIPPAGPLTFANETLIRVQFGSECTFYRLQIIGDYDPITGTGDDAAAAGIKIQENDKVSTYQCVIKGWATPLTNTANGSHKWMAVLDTHITDWRDLGLFVTFEQSAIVGSKIDQNPLATSGPGGKTNEENLNTYAGDGVTTNFLLDNVRVYGDYETNLVVMVRNDSTKVLTELVETTDWTFTEGLNDDGYGNSTHELDLVTPISTGNTLEVRSRIWADHGPIRIPYGQYTCFHNILESYNGWPNDGKAIQPCIRDQSEGTAGGRSNISYNLCKGGVEPIAVTVQNVNTTQYVSSSVVECNYIEADQSSTCFIKTAAGNCTIRNNIGVLQDIAPVGNPFTGALRYANPPGDGGSAELPVRSYNNTFVILRTVANGAEWMPLVYTYQGEGFELKFTDTDEQDNLVYYPDMPTSLPDEPPYPDYLPLSTDGLYRPETGSSALNAGTLKNLVWDDFSGKLIGSNASIGAFATVAPETGTQYFFDFESDTIDAQPADITLMRNAVSGDYLTKSDDGEQVMQFQSTGTENARGASFISITDSPVVEMYTLLKDATTSPPSGRLVAFASDSPDNEYGAYLSASLNSVVLYKRVAGAFTQLASVSVTINTGIYHHLLFKITPGASNQLQVKRWTGDAVNDEPETWLIDTTDSSLTLTSGWVGVVGFDAVDTVKYKGIGIGIDTNAPRAA